LAKIEEGRRSNLLLAGHGRNVAPPLAEARLPACVAQAAAGCQPASVQSSPLTAWLVIMKQIAAGHFLGNHELTAGEKMQSVVLCSFLDENFAIFELANVHHLQERSALILAELITQRRVV